METVGPQGSGKTSLGLHFADRIMEKFPEEILFYRDSVESPVQFNRLNKYQIFCENGLRLKFRDYSSNDYFYIPVTVFNGFAELYEKAKPGQLNVVYFIHEYTWIDFLNYLRRHMHKGSGWKSVFLEEYEDVEVAIRREKQIKGWVRARKVRLIEGKNPYWVDLAKGWFKG